MFFQHISPIQSCTIAMTHRKKNKKNRHISSGTIPPYPDRNNSPTSDQSTRVQQPSSTPHLHKKVRHQLVNLLHFQVHCLSTHYYRQHPILQPKLSILYPSPIKALSINQIPRNRHHHPRLVKTLHQQQASWLKMPPTHYINLMDSEIH